VYAINPATKTETAVPDQPAIFREFPFLLILIFISSLIGNGRVGRVKILSALFKIKMKIKNYTNHTDGNEISTHEDLNSHSCFLINQKVGKQHIKQKNAFAPQTFLVKDTFFPNSPYGELCLMADISLKFSFCPPEI